MTTITGDVGSHPTTTQTGFTSVTLIDGTNHFGDAVTQQAKIDLRNAFLNAEGRVGATPVTGGDLGGLVLTPGVYTDDGSPASLGLTGTLTLDAEGNPNAVFIFQSASTLTAEVSSQVVLVNEAQACNVFWQVGSAATIKTSATFVGTIMAHDDISLQGGATVAGRLLAGAQASGAGALTLINNTIARPVCADLTVSKSHSGDFAQGQVGAVFTLTATNVGPGPTSGTVTVSDTLPAGLTATAISGTGWSCDLASLACTRTDALAAGAAYPSITLSVNVAGDAPGAVTNTATVSGGGELNTGNNTDSDTVTITPTAVSTAPDLIITKTHTGDFQQGGSANYTLTVNNIGSASTSGTVTVSDTLPAELTATAIGGAGWSCDLALLACTRTDALAAGAAYPSITLSATAAGDASGVVTNTATVSGGGELNTSNNTDSDPATITPAAESTAPDLIITKTHTGDFQQGGSANYTLTVNNIGSASTSGTVTVSDTLPAELTATAIGGAGWSCDLALLACTRTDALAAGAAYPSITLSVNVAGDASGVVTNTATVSGGGELNTSNNTDSDTATITPTAESTAHDLSITKSHSGSFHLGGDGAYTLTVNNVGEASTGVTVTVSDTLPAGLTATAISGAGWTCTLASVSCTRSDELAAGSTYPDITVTVSVSDDPLIFRPVAGLGFQPGDILLSMADGTIQWRRPDWTLVELITGVTDGQAKGMAFDASGNLFVTHYFGTGSGNSVTKFDSAGNLLGPFGSGYDCNPSSIVFDRNGDAYVGHADCSGDIFKLNSAGQLLARYDVAVEARGSGHIALDPNQCTMYYGSSGPNVKRFNVCTNTQMPDFNHAPLPDTLGGAQQIALLADGGMLVGDVGVVAQLDASGSLVRTYDMPGGDSQCWLGTALSLDGGSFWATNWCDSSATRFDILTGNVIERHVATDVTFHVKQIIVVPPDSSVDVINTAVVSGGTETNLSNNSSSDSTTITVQPAAPVFTITSAYTAGSPWTLALTDAPPDASIRLIGTTDEQPWVVPAWATTNASGNFSLEGVFAAETQGGHTLRVEIGGQISNTLFFDVSPAITSPPAPMLSIGSSYCVGSPWTLEVTNALPNAPIHLFGTTNGAPWVVTDWPTTDASGKLNRTETFPEGTQGSHTLRVEVGGQTSNTVSLVVSICAP